MKVGDRVVLRVTAALDAARGPRGGKPRAVIARTVNGRGVAFMENVRSWHSDAITREQYEQALAVLGELAQ